MSQEQTTPSQRPSFVLYYINLKGGFKGAILIQRENEQMKKERRADVQRKKKSRVERFYPTHNSLLLSNYQFLSGTSNVCEGDLGQNGCWRVEIGGLGWECKLEVITQEEGQESCHPRHSPTILINGLLLIDPSDRQPVPAAIQYTDRPGSQAQLSTILQNKPRLGNPISIGCRMDWEGGGDG